MPASSERMRWLGGARRRWPIAVEECCIDQAQIARSLGSGSPGAWEVSPKLAPAVLERLAEVQELAAPRVEFVVATAAITNNRSRLLLPELNAALAVGRLVSAQLRGIDAVVVFSLTIGARLERASRKRFSEGQLLEGYVLDALGSMLVESAADAFERRLARELADLGWRMTNRFSPGYCTWATSDQRALFDVLGHRPAGVTLSESCLMFPMKSISGIIGLGEDVVRRAYPCEFCAMESCRQRLVDKAV